MGYWLRKAVYHFVFLVLNWLMSSANFFDTLLLEIMLEEKSRICLGFFTLHKVQKTVKPMHIIYFPIELLP